MRLDTTALQRFAPAIVVLAAVAVYLNAIANGFAFDDRYIILENTRVHDITAMRDIWLTPYWPFFGSELGLYRPFIIFVYAIQWAIGGGVPWVFHLGNIVLHASAALLAYLLLDRLTSRVPALIGGMIFAVHPLHTEAVANVVGQAELVAGIAIFGACLVHVARPAGVAVSWPRRLALALLFAIGLATKESAVILPGLLLALDFAQRRVRLSIRGFADYADAMLMPVFLLAATLAFYLIMRFDALSGALIGLDAAPSLPFLREDHRVLNALRAFPEFVRLLFFPLDLVADYSPGVILPVESLTMMTLLGALLLCGLVVLALLTPWWPAAGLPAAWFVISMITIANLFFPIGVVVAERTLYVPSFAVSLLVAILWQHAAPHASVDARRAAPALAAIVMLLFGYRTWIRNDDWKSTQTVLLSLITEHPESYKSQWVQASTLYQKGFAQDSEYHWELAYRIYPRDSQFLLEYGRYLVDTGRVEKGIEIIEQSYEMHPFIPRTVMVLAYAYVRAGRYTEGLERLAGAEHYNAHWALTMPMRAAAYAGLGDYDRAVAAWRVAIKHTTINPWVTWGFLARTFAIRGDRDEALASVQQALALTADSAAHHTLRRLETAITNGCYDGVRGPPVAASQQSAAAAHANGDAPVNGTDVTKSEHAHSALPDCDPLGDYFTFGERQAKTANKLQNATEVSADSVVSRGNDMLQPVKK